MAKVDLLLTSESGITASDGSIVTNGAILKFDAELEASSTKIKIFPKLYRNRKALENGYQNIILPESIIPYEFTINFTADRYYSLTLYDLYKKVGDYMNKLLGGDYFELITIK